jgi:hypothetical protein
MILHHMSGVNATRQHAFSKPSGPVHTGMTSVPASVPLSSLLIIPRLIMLLSLIPFLAHFEHCMRAAVRVMALRLQHARCSHHNRLRYATGLRLVQ